MDFEKVKKEYGVYEGVNVSTFKHIPEISSYDYNWFVGLKREGMACHDLLFARSNEEGFTEWYIVKSCWSKFIGYNLETEGVIHLMEDRL